MHQFISTNYKGMIKEGEELAKIDKNVVIKLPMTKDGIKATSYFSKRKLELLRSSFLPLKLC